MKMYVILILNIVLLINISVKAQNKKIGIVTGYGISTDYFNNEFISVNLPNKHADLYDYYSIGINYYYHPYKAFFNLKSGINYDYKKKQSLKFSFIKLPLDINFSFGNKFRFIIGFGLYSGYIISSKGIENFIDYEETSKKWNFGIKANIGIEYKIYEKISMNLLVEFNNDKTALYYYDMCSAKSANTLLKLGVKYDISN